MSKLCVALCLVLFASATSATNNCHLANSTVIRLNNKIISRINETAMNYATATNTSEEIFTNITTIIGNFTRDKLAGIMENFETRQEELNDFMSGIADIDFSDCVHLIEDFNSTVQDAINDINICANKELTSAECIIKEIRNGVSEGFKNLKVYRKEQEKCQAENANAAGSYFPTLRCLLCVNSKLPFAYKTRFSWKIRNLKKPLATLETDLVACATDSSNVYYENSLKLIDAIKQCIPQ